MDFIDTVCARFFVEADLPVWPPMLMRYYTFTLPFLLTLEPSVSDIHTVAPTCPYFVGGGV